MTARKNQFSQEEIINNKQEINALFNPEYAKAIVEKTANPINKVWFRAKLIGWEEIPERNNPERPLIYATNHSGMAFPWDAMIFGSIYNEYTNYGEDSIRALTAPMLSASNLMNPFTIPNVWKRSGSVDATFLNFETMMHQTDHNILVYPEGIPGIGKGFNRKYQLQELKTSFLRMSVKYETDIIPFYTVNAEYNNPYSYNSNAINKIVNIIGIPFLPLGFITPFILLQPWIFYFAFPANMKYVKGERISPYKMVDKPYEEISQDEFKELSAKIHVKWQKGLSDAVEKYGKKPFNWKTLFKSFKEHSKLLFAGLPFFWVILFYEFERLFKKHGNGNFEIKTGFFRNIGLIFKNPFLIFYFIPILGWIPIAVKGYKGNKLKKKKKKNL